MICAGVARRWLCLCMAWVVALALFSAPAASAESAEFSEGAFTFSVSSGYAIVLRFSGQSSDAILPAVLGGAQVAFIAGGAFQDCATLRTLSIPDSVIQIADDSFKGDGELVLTVVEHSYAHWYADSLGMAYRLATPAEATATPEVAETPEATEAPEDLDGVYSSMLDFLENPQYRLTYQYLLDGGVIRKGDKGDEAKGLQQLLADMGAAVKPDGSVGGKTIQAMNAVQAAFGLSITEEAGIDAFRSLLDCAVLCADLEEGYLYLPEYANYDQELYMEAAAYAQKGYFYTAQSLFEELEYEDSAERAEVCVQKWPGAKELYHNPDHKSSKCQIQFKNKASSDRASFAKVYNYDDELVSTVFVPGGKSKTIRLPPGDYMVSIGSGTEWYGPAEAFGDAEDAYYETLEFEDGEQYETIQSGYILKLTLNTDSGNLSSDSQDWTSF